MVFVWRGLGLMVPIIMVICGLIVSIWIKDTRLGNPHFMGWTSFYTAIVLLLPGIAMWGGTDNEDGTRKKHDFFFVPILIWALAFGILSAVLLFGYDNPPGEDSDDSNDPVAKVDESDKKEIIYRTINFLNSGTDSIEVVITNENGETDRFKVGPKTWLPRDIEPHVYTFAAYGPDGKAMPDFPIKKTVSEPTKSKADYDAAWMQLDGGEHKLIMVDVTAMMPSDFTTTELKKIDWTEKLLKVYEPNTLMEPAAPKDASVYAKILEPGDLLPTSGTANHEVYALITVPSEQELNNEYLQKRLIELYFE